MTMGRLQRYLWFTGCAMLVAGGVGSLLDGIERKPWWFIIACLLLLLGHGYSTKRR